MGQLTQISPLESLEEELQIYWFQDNVRMHLQANKTLDVATHDILTAVFPL